MTGVPSTVKEHGLFEGVSPADEAAIAAFDQAFEPFEPDPELLSTAPGRNLSKAIKDFVHSVTHLDIDRVLRHNGWWSRFTGADLEARLEFEIASHKISGDMMQLSSAASVARRAIALMQMDMERLASSGHSHEALAHETTLFLAHANQALPNVARLQRRLGNLETMIASNHIVGAQMRLAIGHLVGLLDQYTDIEKSLFPLWSHHALAVAQGAGGEAASESLAELKAVRGRLAKFASTLE
jgi:hypothetical protein